MAEYCEGGSLAKDPYRFYHHIGGAATELSLIAEGLQAAHAVQVIHRDVKPGNILFRKDGTPVLGDFGICHMEGDQRITLADEAMGSRNYIAPEMESGGRRLGPPTERTDVYSLGKVLYWMVTGGGEFARENHRALDLYLPSAFLDEQWEHVHALLDEMVVEKPQDRLPMGQVITRLHEVANLMSGRYTPLRGSMALRCRFCGKGFYERYAGKGQPVPLPQTRGWFTEIQRTPTTDLRVLRCNHCGHVEWFDFRGIQDQKWWER